MRTLFFLLLLANVTMAAYAWLDRRSAVPDFHLDQQIKADQIRILTPEQVSALALDPTMPPANTCAVWGPFTDNDRVRAQADIEPLMQGRAVRPRAAGSAASSLVLSDPPQAALTRMHELQPAYPGAEIRIGSCERMS